MNSGKYDGLSTEEFKEIIIKWLEKNKVGQSAINYRLRDWLVSRQRYWGCPIPIIHCSDCGAVAVPEKDLPVELPDLDDYAPRDDGKSPLAKHKEWLNVDCPKCGESAERESDTLDTFVDSSWYFLRYTDPQNSNEFAARDKMKKWLPIDFYSGGAEHNTMHLIYSRFWIKAMHDLKLLDFDEPYVVRKNRGLIMGPDGQKMSKSKGNVMDPDEYVDKLGADTVRMYLAFIGPYNEVGAYPWDMQGIVGVRKFLDRVWRLREKMSVEAKDEIGVQKLLHQTIKKVTEDIEKLKFNTAVSQLMILVNLLEKQSQISQKTYSLLTILLSAFAPHLAEELWLLQGHKDSILSEAWPDFDANLARIEEIELVVQINGKVRDRVIVSVDITQAEAEKLVLSLEKIKSQLQAKQPKKIIFVPGRLINIVV
jgi:leucyl-tRNA synthetase